MMEYLVEEKAPKNRTGENQNKKQEVTTSTVVGTGTLQLSGGNSKQESALERVKWVIEQKKAEAKARRSSKGGGDFIDIADGETKLIKFNPDKIRDVEREVTRKHGTKVKLQRIEYSGLIDINDPMGGEKRKDFAYKWAEMINAQLDEGFRLLKITRPGSDMNDTSYTVTPVNASNLQER